MMEYALDLVQKYASERIQGGKPIKDYFAIKEKICKISEFVNIVSEVIDNLSENPEKIHRKSFFITGFALRESTILLSEAIQIFGGYGYMKDFKVEKLYREAETLRNLTEIYKLEFFKPEF
jgi:alkylation response protein AidB-like acyl-CoA dehydrogenase